MDPKSGAAAQEFGLILAARKEQVIKV